MYMERDKHEEILNQLLDPALEQSVRTELLQSLRVDYSNVTTNIDERNSIVEKLTSDNSDLIVSNSKLFRQIGIVGSEKEEEVVQKEFSEEVTIESLEGVDK